jgi:Transposase
VDRPARARSADRDRVGGHPQLRHWLARALSAAGLAIVEIERPARRDRRRGKSDPIDAHLAAMQALRLPADRLPVPRADGDREALRILLGARRDLSTAKTRMVNRLRALLLTGDNDDRIRARAAMTTPALAAIARRRPRRDETREQAVRRAEARRLALGIRDADRDLKDKRPSSPRWSRSWPRPAGQNRRGTSQRRPGHRVVVAPRPLPQRRGLRRSGRRQSHPGQQRPHRPLPTHVGGSR